MINVLGCQILNDSNGFHPKWQILDDLMFLCFSFMFVLFHPVFLLLLLWLFLFFPFSFDFSFSVSFCFSFSFSFSFSLSLSLSSTISLHLSVFLWEILLGLLLPFGWCRCFSFWGAP